LVIYTTKGLTGVQPNDPADADQATLTIIYEVAAGTKQFCLEIKQDPFIGVSVDDTTAPLFTIDIESKQLDAAALAGQKYTQGGAAVDSPTDLVASTNTSFRDLTFLCDKKSLINCVDNAVIDCYDKIVCDLKKIHWLCLLDSIRPRIAICVEQIEVIHHKTEHPDQKPHPQPVPQHHQQKIACFLDICVKATVIVEAIFAGHTNKYYQGLHLPTDQYRRQCEQLLHVATGVTVDTHVRHQRRHCPPKPHHKLVKRNKRKHDSESDEKEDKKDAYGTGSYVAGGVGIAFVSVAVYVGYSFLT